MLPADFPQSNYVYEKPNNVSDELCVNLPAWKGVAENDGDDSLPIIISCWRFNKEDLETIQRTGQIWISIMSDNLPPIALQTVNPFVEDEKV